MNMKHLTKTLAAIIAAAGLAACNDGDMFHIEGSISGAKDSVLYFENMSLEGPVKLDSLKLDDEGYFRFSGITFGAPEFYRLRIADRIINLSADSTETIIINAEYDNMATDYDIEGSADCYRIKELAIKQIELHRKVMALDKAGDLTNDERIDSLMKMIEAYKEEVKNEYIFVDPKAASSYFALFQTLGDYLIFNPRSNSDDIRVFRAVATSWDTFYPGAIRGENLRNIAIEGTKTDRIVSANREREIDPAKVSEAGVIDISLTDNKGRRRSLTELKGKVVLLDFHAFGTSDSPARILSLRELYNKYHDRGLEIYQVSVDTDEHFWKQQTAALPWISVRDDDGPAAQCVTLYNVRSVPEFFLIDRSNTLVSRSVQIKNLEADIEKLL